MESEAKDPSWGGRSRSSALSLRDSSQSQIHNIRHITPVIKNGKPEARSQH